MSIPAVYFDGTSPTELYYIAPVANVPSILKHGILSQSQIKEVIGKPYVDSPELYDISLRSCVKWDLHKSPLAPKACLSDYANLYLRAHNAELKKRNLDDTCVLRIDPQILNQTDVFITNQTATIKSGLEFFRPGEKFFNEIATELIKQPEDLVSDDDQIKAFQRKMIHQAEVLVPNKVDSLYIKGVFIANEVAQFLLNETWQTSSPNSFPLSVQLQPSLFFPKVPVQTALGFNPCIIKPLDQ